MTTVSQIAHISRKDVTALRGSIATVIALFVIPAALVSFGVSLNYTRDNATFAYPELLRALVTQTVCVLFVMALIHLDRPGAPRAHWMATPVSRQAMVASKMLTVLFVLLPAAAIAQIVALRSQGVGIAESYAFLLESLLGVLNWALTAALLAAVFQSTSASIFALVLYGVCGTAIANGLFPMLLHWFTITWASNTVLASIAALVKCVTLFAIFVNAWRPATSRAVALTCLFAVLFLAPAVITPEPPEQQPVLPQTKELEAPFSATITRDSQDVYVRVAAIRPATGERYALVEPKFTLTHATGRVLAANAYFSTDNSSFNSDAGRETIRLFSSEAEFLNNTSYQGDSIIFTLRYSARESEAIDLRNATADFRVFLERQRSTVVLDQPVNVAARSVLEPRVMVTPPSDTVSSFVATTIGLGSAARSSMYFMDRFLLGRQTRTYRTSGGYVLRNFEQVYNLVRTTDIDTLPLVTTGSGMDEDQILLPIPLTLLQPVRIGFVPHWAVGKPDRNAWRNSRLVVKRWTYTSHSPLQVTVRLQ